MDRVSRRAVLGAGSATLLGGVSGCLSDGDVGDDAGDENDPTDAVDSVSLDSPAAWLPATDERLVVRYTDHEAVRDRQSDLDDGTRGWLTSAPDGAAGTVLSDLSPRPTLSYALQFGPEGTGGHAVVGGDFGGAAFEGGTVVGERDGFELRELSDPSATVARSDDVVVVSPAGAGDVEAVVETAVEGVGRLVDADPRVGTALEAVDGDATFLGIVPEPDADAAPYVQSWSIGADETTFTATAVSDGSADDPRAHLVATGERIPTVNALSAMETSVEDTVATVTGTVPTDEFVYVDFYGDEITGTSVPFTTEVAADVDTMARTIGIRLLGVDDGARVHVRDRGETRATISPGDDEVRLEYDAETDPRVTFLAARGDAETDFPREPITF